jgi:pectate disaccharide-lyase
MGLSMKKKSWTAFTLLAAMVSVMTYSAYTSAAEVTKSVYEPTGMITDYYVSVTGNDANLGTVNAPWASIQKAVDNVKPGGTVYIKGGVYHQTIRIHGSGTDDLNYITVKSAPGEQVVLDGTGMKIDSDGVVLIDGQSYIRVEGLQITNFRTKAEGTAGIKVQGASRHVKLINNRIHDLGIDYGGSKVGDAHGIAVYGTSEIPAEDIEISGNELYNLRLGSSEALAVNGNVRHFEIIGNSVHDCDNIGIVIIGFEHVSPDPETDRARDGIVSGNQVYRNSSYGNPAYGNEYSAGGIYVDGGTNITIDHNDSHHNDYGIELASEHAVGNTSNVRVIYNNIDHNNASGLSLGGYDKLRGSTFDCEIVDNVFRENNAKHLEYGEFNFAYDTHNNVIERNKVSTNEDGIFITNEFAENVENTVDYNTYESNGPEKWNWKGRMFTDFESYQNETDNDIHSSFHSK